MSKKHDLPYMPFYFGDWMKCPEVRALDLETRMIWFEMLGFMWESTERGYLTLNNKSIDIVGLSRMLGITEERLKGSLNLMDNLRVYSKRETDGAIYCRRMVRDQQKREDAVKYGKLGGNPDLRVKGEVNPKVNPPLIYDIDIDIESKFEEVRILYGGTKRGLKTELDNFISKHKNYKEILPLLKPAIEKQIKVREELVKQKKFVPEWKHFKTWINNKCWEEETKIEPETEKHTYRPPNYE